MSEETKKPLSRDELLSKFRERTRPVEVEVPELGTVNVRMISAEEAFEYTKRLEGLRLAEDNTGDPAFMLDNVRAMSKGNRYLVAVALLDGDGRRMFADGEDDDELGTIDPDLMRAIAAEIKRANGMTREKVAEEDDSGN